MSTNTVDIISDLKISKTLNKLKMRDAKGNKLNEDNVDRRRTIESTKRFQAICDINMDGIVGPNTMSTIQSIFEKPLLQVGDRGSVVRYIQYRVGAQRDGIFDNNTKMFVSGWQKVNHLTPDGIVGPQSWEKLIG